MSNDDGLSLFDVRFGIGLGVGRGTAPGRDAASFHWANVVSSFPEPLGLRLDGDSMPLLLDVDSLVDPASLSVGDRVWVQMVGTGGRRVIVLGRSAAALTLGSGEGGWSGSLAWTQSGVAALRGPAATAAQMVTIPTHDGSGQTRHPSVQHVPAGLSGYSYWMAVTPYPGGSAAHEDPNIVASLDGVTWEVPAGLTNPIDDKPGGNSDPCLLWDGGRLHLWFRFNDTGSSEADEVIKHCSSVDGVTWSIPDSVILTDSTERVLLSPSVIRDRDGSLTMWAVDTVPTPNRIVRMSAPGPSGPWTVPQTGLNPTVPAGQEPWHIEVRLLGGLYVALINTCDLGTSGTNATLILATSTDGMVWHGPGTAVVAPFSSGAHSRAYKGSFLPSVTPDGAVGLTLWYSGPNGTTWRTFRTQLTAKPISDSGTVPIGVVAAGTGKNTPVTFTTRFPAPPRVFVTGNGARLNYAVGSVTATGFNFLSDNWSPGGTSALTEGYWTAVLY